MTAVYSIFDLTDGNSASSTSATATITTDLGVIEPNDKLLHFQIGSRGVIIKIENRP